MWIFPERGAGCASDGTVIRVRWVFCAVIALIGRRGITRERHMKNNLHMHTYEKSINTTCIKLANSISISTYMLRLWIFVIDKTCTFFVFFNFVAYFS
jgi:hypothetical protein